MSELRALTPAEELLVIKVCKAATHRFVDRLSRMQLRHTDVDALEMRAQYAAIQAVRRFDPSIGCQLHNWVYRMAWHALQHEAREQFPGTRVDYEQHREKPRVVSMGMLTDEGDLLEYVSEYVNSPEVYYTGDEYLVPDLLQVLPERSRRVIHMRYWEQMSQQQIADQIGVCQMQVSRIEKKSLAAMRKAAGV